MADHTHVEKQKDGTPKLVTVKDCDCGVGMDQTELPTDECACEDELSNIAPSDVGGRWECPNCGVEYIWSTETEAWDG